MLVYLAAVRPFREALLQAVELTCHALEAGLFACALALVNAQPNNGAATTYVMVGELQALKAAGARVLSPASGFIPMPRSHARAPHYATYGSDLRPRSAFVAFLRTSITMAATNVHTRLTLLSCVVRCTLSHAQPVSSVWRCW